MRKKGIYEYKRVIDGVVIRHAFYRDGSRHGEHKYNGKYSFHRLYVDGVAIMEGEEIERLTEQEKFKLSLKYGVKWIPEGG